MFSFGTKVAIDIGSYKIRLAQPGSDQLIEDMNVVFFPTGKNYQPFFGKEALKNNPSSVGTVEVIWPMQEGVIKNFYSASIILQAYKQRLFERTRFVRPKVIAASSYDASVIEKQILYDLVADKFGKHVLLVDSLSSAAIGAGLDVCSDDPKFMLQIGAGVTTIGAVGVGQTLCAQSIRRAGNWLDISIQRHLYERLGIQINQFLCRQIKHEIGTFKETELDKSWRGNVQDDEGNSIAFQLSSKELMPVLEKGLESIVEELYWFLKQLPENISQFVHIKQLRPYLIHMPKDIEQRVKKEGIVLGGGSACLPGLQDWLSARLGVPIHTPEKPDLLVISGIKKVLSEFNKFFQWYNK